MPRAFSSTFLGLLFAAPIVGLSAAPKGGFHKTMMLIPGGEFEMGSRNGRADERPVRAVRVNAFYMDETPITYREYRRLRKFGLVKTSYWLYDSYNKPEQPVTGVRWHEAACICNMRSRLAGLQPSYFDTGRVDRYGYPVWDFDPKSNGMRLPTEAEWERAARGGKDGQDFAWGSGFRRSLANMDEGRGVAAGRWWRLANVRTQYRNRYGLYGMNGNVWEWIDDNYLPDAYAKLPAINPRPKATGGRRVLRGGSWGSFRTEDLRSARRSWSAPGNYNFDIGFRCVRPARAQAQSLQARAWIRSNTCRVVSKPVEPSRTLDAAFTKRLGRYLRDYFAESVYFHQRVDRQSPTTPDELAELIVSVSKQHRVHPLFLVGIMKAESGLGTVSFPRWFNNPMAYDWGNWKMANGLPVYKHKRGRNRRYSSLATGFHIYSKGIRRKLYVRAANQNLYRFHYIYVGYEAREWMRTVATVYRDVLGIRFGEGQPPAEAGRFIYLDWQRLNAFGTSGEVGPSALEHRPQSFFKVANQKLP